MNQCTVKNHRFITANWLASPNYNQRPSSEISLIVIHNISLPPGKFGADYICQFFTNCLDFNAHPFFASIKSLKVSSHLLIVRNGTLFQFVDFDKRAWHAGESEFMGRKNCNDFSIGIELEGTDDQAYTEQQYQILSQVIKTLQANYAIEHIVGHSDIAGDRKTDPGQSFDWSKIT